MSEIVLTCDRIVLRTLTTEDVTEQYVSWLNDKAVNQYLESRFVAHDRSEVVEFIKKVSSQSSILFLGIFIKNGEKHIGNIKLNINPQHRRGSIGLMIGDRESWGRGYATEAIRELVRYSFDELDLEKITAACYESNLGSKRAFLKVGFKVEGFLRGHVDSATGREGVFYLGMLPGDTRPFD